MARRPAPVLGGGLPPRPAPPVVAPAAAGGVPPRPPAPPAAPAPAGAPPPAPPVRRVARAPRPAVAPVRPAPPAPPVCPPPAPGYRASAAFQSPRIHVHTANANSVSGNGLGAAAIVAIVALTLVVLGWLFFGRGIQPTMTLAAPVATTAPAQRSAAQTEETVRVTSNQPQFRDVRPAPDGLGRDGCKEWYNAQGFSSAEFWDEASQVCR